MNPCKCNIICAIFSPFQNVKLLGESKKLKNQMNQASLLTPYLSKKAHFGSGRWKNFKSGNHPFKLSFLPLDAPSSELSFDITRILVGLEMIDCRSIEAP